MPGPAGANTFVSCLYYYKDKFNYYQFYFSFYQSSYASLA
jgi:hypothetical protein